MAYTNGQLSVLSEPESVSEHPVLENMSIQLASSSQYQSRVLFVREEHFRGNWRLCHLQPTMLSAVVMLTALEFLPDAGMYCAGPVDPWSFNDCMVLISQHAIYWIPCAICASISPSACHMLHAQVSTCPFWAFSAPEYSICFLVHQLIYFDFSAF